jgi:hypothetical protein
MNKGLRALSASLRRQNYPLILDFYPMISMTLQDPIAANLCLHIEQNCSSVPLPFSVSIPHMPSPKPISSPFTLFLLSNERISDISNEQKTYLGCGPIWIPFVADASQDSRVSFQRADCVP